MSERIRSVDALRGLAAVLMIIYHGMYDAVYYLAAPDWLIENPAAAVLNMVIAVLFVAIAGISSRFSRNNLKRGILVFAAGLLVSLVTYFAGNPVKFGVLHCLGLSMIIFHFTERLWDRVPWAPAVFAVLFAAGLAAGKVNAGTDIFCFLGFHSGDFYSADYYPLLPWFFLFLFGAWLGKRRLPDFFRCRPLEFIGRHTLIIYLAHQPVLIGIMLAAGRI